MLLQQVRVAYIILIVIMGNPLILKHQFFTAKPIATYAKPWNIRSIPKNIPNTQRLSYGQPVIIIKPKIRVIIPEVSTYPQRGRFRLLKEAKICVKPLIINKIAITKVKADETAIGLKKDIKPTIMYKIPIIAHNAV